jgi:hypothetical protein
VRGKKYYWDDETGVGIEALNISIIHLNPGKKFQTAVFEGG